MRGLMVVAILGVCVGTLWAGEGAAVERAEKAVPQLGTEAFESGELKITEVPARQLEAMLQDLNRRKDYDWSQHDGKPGPDDAYLWGWVQTVTKELLRRGYGIDENGNLRRPGAIVPLR